MTTLLTVFLTLAAFSGVPLFIVIAAAALASFALLGVDLSIVIIEMYRLAANPMLSALLLFALAGYILAEGNASKRLVRLSTAIIGRAPGGLAIVTILSCAFFTALTGASGVTIVALGGLLFPALLEDHYPEQFSLGLLTSCGSLGLLFPPSLPLIIYGMVAEVEITSLFMAGLLPGALMLVLLSLYSVYKGARAGSTGARTPFSLSELIGAVLEAKWDLMLPVVVLGGIFSGLLVLSEAAAVTALYVLFVELVIHRDVKPRALPSVMVRTSVMIGAIMVILGASLAFNSFLIDQQVPNRIFEYMRGHIQSPFTFLVLLNIFLLAVGCVLDIFSALIIVVPLILPIAQNYGVDPIHLGIIFLTNLQIGYMTPPIGMNLFIASLRFEKSIISLYYASIPFLVLLLLTLVVITFYPPLSLFLAG